MPVLRRLSLSRVRYPASRPRLWLRVAVAVNVRAGLISPKLRMASGASYFQMNQQRGPTRLWYFSPAGQLVSPKWCSMISRTRWDTSPRRAFGMTCAQGTVTGPYRNLAGQRQQGVACSGDGTKGRPSARERWNGARSGEGG